MNPINSMTNRQSLNFNQRFEEINKEDEPVDEQAEF